MPTAEVHARAVFDPSYLYPPSLPWARPGFRPHDLLLLLVGFYRSRLAWVALAVTSLIVIYAGGAAMFYFHSVLLGEGGPAISPLLHWFVDSTAGLFALAPVLAVLVPLAGRYAFVRPGVLRPLRYALFSGALFAVATGPGPVLHNTFVGRGTWLAAQVTNLWGDGRALGPAAHIPPTVDMALQVAYGLPIYVALMWVSLTLVRRMVAARG